MLLVVIDSHSKWIEVEAATSANTINSQVKIFCKSRYTKDITVSDRARYFTSDEFKSFTEANGVRRMHVHVHVYAPPYHPASNGMAERAVQTVKTGLRKIKRPSLQLRIAKILARYRITPQASTQRSWAELLLRRIPRIKLDMVKPDVHSDAHHAQRRMTSQATSSNRKSFQVSEAVFTKNFSNRVQTWIPGRIDEKLGESSFMIELSDGRIVKQHIHHVRHHLCLHVEAHLVV